MKILIDIDENDFLACKHWLNEGVSQWAESIIANGTPFDEEVQKSEWIEVDIKPTPYGGYTCNRKCKRCNYFTKEYRLNFCPNCGAKMLKDKEGGLV